jgi:hypothetical protein
MYLRRFANSKERLVMVSRENSEVRHPTSVNKACNEVGFYTIPTGDLEVQARAGHDPERVEAIFAAVEGDSRKYIAEILDGGFPPSLEARYRLSMFIALQIARGWGFRRDVENIANIMAPDFVAMQATPDRVRATLRRSGRPHGDTEVEQMIARLTGPDGPRPVLRQGHYVQYMLQFAIETVMPSLWSRTWRLLDFGEPALLTSDEPVAILQPGGRPAGPGNSPAIWFPLDRQRALALTTRGEEQVVRSGLTRARQINSIVASQAERWIFYHPDDAHLLDLDLGPRMQLVDEVVSVQQVDDTVRELHRLVKRPAGRLGT